MTTKTKSFITLLALVFVSVPGITHADTSSVQQQKLSLGAQLTALEAELATSTPGVAYFNLSPGQSIVQASSTAKNGILTISLPAFLQTKPDPTIPATVPQTITHYAKVTFEFDPCVAAAPSFCLAQASSSYPVMTSILSQGQDTGYLHYILTLNSLSSTTASFAISDSTLFATIQNQLNDIATHIAALTSK